MPVPAPPSPPAHANFNFTIDSLRITNTRSRHEDTDFVSFTLLTQLGDGRHTTQTLNKGLGDLNNGTCGINLSFMDVKVDANQAILMNYLVVNSGHSDTNKIYATLQTAGSNLATAGLAALGGAIGSAIPIPGLGTALGALGGWLVGEVGGLIFANCDGPVAIEQVNFPYHDLIARTAHGKFTHETQHPGTDSAHGCGSNSMYYVNWHIERVG